MFIVQRVVSLLQTKLVFVATTVVSALPPGSTGARCTISLAEAHPVAAREAFAECCTRHSRKCWVFRRSIVSHRRGGCCFLALKGGTYEGDAYGSLWTIGIV
jgi:hypothetical protein